MISDVTLAIAALAMLVLVIGGVAFLTSGRRKPAPTLPAEDVAAPEVPSGRMIRLRSRLADSQSTLGRGLLAVISRDRLDDAAWRELEETLLAADLGVGPTTELVDALRTRVRVQGVTDPTAAKQALRASLLELVDPDLDRSLHLGTGE